MKLLVLGGSGLIGNEIIKKAIHSHEVFATTNTKTLTMSNVSTIKINFLNNFKKLEEFIVDVNPDAVINLVANTDLEDCENHKQNAYELNVLLTEKLSNICNKLDSKFIHISSDYIFDGKKGNYNEDDDPNPINYYGYTKQISEDKALKYPNSVVIRTALVYDLKLRSKFLRFVSEKLSRNERVFAFDDLFSTPVSVTELSESILKILNMGKEGIFHVVGDECINRYEFAKIIAKRLGHNEELIIPQSVKSYSEKIPRPLNSCLNNNKIKKELGMKYYSIEKNLEKLNYEN